MPTADPAVLFDWDGTLLDSAPSTTAAWRVVLGELGCDAPPELLASLFGAGWPDAYLRVAERWDVPDGQLVSERLAQARRALPPAALFADAQPAIDGLRRAGVRVALVTNSSRDRLDREMRGLAINAGHFAAIVTADMVDRAKPTPDCYLRALSMLGDPAPVVAIEDSPAGVAAASAAGVPVLMIDRDGQRPADGSAAAIGRLDPDEIASFLRRGVTS